jgi:hypothetical protein
MSKKEKEKEKIIEELAKEWCYCEIHKKKYLCEDGCPECNK